MENRADSEVNRVKRLLLESHELIEHISRIESPNIPLSLSKRSL